MLVAAVCGPTHAEDLIRLIPQFYGSEFVLRPNSGMHEGHFQDSPGAVLTMVSLVSSIAIQSTNYPVGSSSGSLVYTKEADGRLVRASETFGPIISERALTLGKGKINFGMAFQHSTYDDFEGLGLDNGDLQFVLRHADGGMPGSLDPFFEGDIVRTNVNMDLSRTESLFFLNYGISSRIDVGFVLPLVSVKFDSTINGLIERLSTAADGDTFHAFEVGGATSGGCTPVSELTCAGSFEQTETGIGDIALRSKMRLMTTKATSIAGILDIRLPTGDEANLLGLGATEVEGQFVSSWEFGSISPHFNAGYSLSSGDYEIPIGAQVFTVEPPDEAAVSAGLSWATNHRLTLGTDFIYRRFFDVTTASSVPQEFEYFTTAGAGPFTAIREQITPMVDDVDTVLGTVGFKAGIAKGALLSGAVFLPISSGNGLEDDFSILFALDWTR